MKKNLIAILCFTMAFAVSAQELLFYPQKKEFIPAEIKLTDGSVLYGYIQDFSLPRTFEFRTMVYDFSAIESKLKMDRKDFKYKATMDGEARPMNLDDISYLLVKGDETVAYEKVKLKTVNAQKEVVDLEREVMVPILKEGNINLYGVGVSSCQAKDCQLIYIIVYVKHKDQEHAFIPIDYNRINFFNTGSLDDKFFESFAQVGKDCPEFLDYLETSKKQFDDKTYRKTLKDEYKAFQKIKKERLKEIKGAKNKRIAENEMDTEIFLSIYTKIINEYDSRCGVD